MPRRVLALACVVAAVGSACSHGRSASHEPVVTTPSSTQSASAARRTQLLKIGTLDVQNAGRKATLSGTTSRAVMRTAQKYVDSAILTPLETGKLGRDYPKLFTAGVRPAATGADLRVLTELGVGKTTTIGETATPVAMSALIDGLGLPVYVATSFHVKVTTTTAGRVVVIDRAVELTFEPVARSWLIVAYRTTVKRTAPVRTPRRTTTTTRSRPRPTRG
jgi:hypothetical protein